MYPEHVVMCTHCTQMIVGESSTSESTIEHWSTLAQLRLSSASCGICKILLGCLAERAMQARRVTFKDVDESAIEQYPLSFEIRGTRAASEVHYKYVQASISFPARFVYDISFHVATCETKVPPPLWDSFPSCVETKLQKIRDWLRICESSHPDCGSRWQCRLPTRLVDIGVNGQEDFKLISTAGLDSKEAKYTTLSYCWGSSKFLTTTKETVSAFHYQIPRLQMPKSFLDAAAITRALGLRYLWIDALCIVQDDSDDWATESSKMSDVYHGSTLTVNAIDSKSPEGGVFVQNMHPLSQRTTFERAFLQSAQVGDRKSTVIHFVPQNLDTVPLNERGWTLQESILSPRTVGVTNLELTWKCGSGTFWESGIELARSDSFSGNARLLKPESVERKNRVWWNWMTHYSRRRFTVPSDRLPAMLGIVDYYQRITHDVPVLGMWESSLRQDLIWMRVESRNMGLPVYRLPDDMADYNLPSWSPLSCDLSIMYDFWGQMVEGDPGAEFCLDVIEYSVSWEGTPYLSSVRSSSLVVDGPTQNLYLSEGAGVSINPPGFIVDDDVVNDPSQLRCAVQWDKEGYRSPQTWLCLLVKRRSVKGYERGGETFIVLEAAGPQKYRRIGLGSLGRRRIPGGLAEQDWKFDLRSRTRLTLV